MDIHEIEALRRRVEALEQKYGELQERNEMLYKVLTSKANFLDFNFTEKTTKGDRLRGGGFDPIGSSNNRTRRSKMDIDIVSDDINAVTLGMIKATLNSEPR